MNTLPIAPAPIPTLASKPAQPPLIAQTKAQRLRPHAQEKRGFKEHLADRKATDSTARSEKSGKADEVTSTPEVKENKAAQQVDPAQTVARGERTGEAATPRSASDTRETPAAKPEAEGTQLEDRARETEDARELLDAQPVSRPEQAEPVQKSDTTEHAVQPQQTDQVRSSPSQQQADQARQQVDQARQQTHQTQADEPFVQRVVAQVFQAVDPALKFKPSSLARAAGTVSGNAAAAMRSSGIEQQSSFPTQNAEPSTGGLSSGGQTPFVDPAATAPASLDSSMADTLAFSQDAGAERSSQVSTPVDHSSSASKPAGGHAAAAVDVTAAAMNPAAVVAAKEAGRFVEPRLTLAPTLTTVAIGASSLPVVSASGAAGKPAGSTPPPPSPLAQQVQQGLEVAMHDLPAPAGDRLVTLRLHPSSLGSLRIAMHVSGDAVQVRFQVGSAKAKASIGKSMEDLKAAIGRQGLRVESMEVEEDRALAAPNSPSLDHEGQGAPGPVAESGSRLSGKGFAQLLDAPHGPDGPRAAEAPDRTSSNAEAENEGGVLQVLTFRLEAVG